MKKLILLITILYTVPSMAMPGDPYSFIPSKMYQMDDRVFYKGKEMIEITPEKPLIVRDKEGNIMLTSSNGKVMVQIDTAGQKTFHIGGEREYRRGTGGEVEQRYIKEEGGRVRIENEQGDVIGYEEYGLGGKLLATYDEEGNKTREINYDSYGQRRESAIDMLTMTRTVYDDSGSPQKEVDYEGNEIAKYEYDEHGRVLYKEDIAGNVTHYKKDGRMSMTYNRDGELTATYNYKKNEQGYRVLDTVHTVKSGQGELITIYEDGRQQKTVDNAGKLVKEYKWIGSRLVYEKNVDEGKITWFSNGKPIYMTHEGKIIQEWDRWYF